MTTAREPDIAAVAAAIGDPSRARVLLALAEGRALPASLLAGEAGVGLSTVSAHLARLLRAGLVSCELQGRHRYYRLARIEVAQALEALTRVAPPSPIRSLREGTRAAALRRARTCYDHLAGRLGGALMAALLDEHILTGGDGMHHRDRVIHDQLATPGRDIPYRVTDCGTTLLHEFGIDIDGFDGRRPLIRYCVDWSEQRHHLAGALGGALAQRLFELEWIRHGPSRRVVLVTDRGRHALADRFNIELGEEARHHRIG